MTNYDCVIIADGDFPNTPFPLQILHKTQQVVCCDGAIVKLLDYNKHRAEGCKPIEPTAIVGDGDSIPKQLKERCKQILHIIDDQETNDLTKAINYAIEQNAHTIAILGATGKREDHTLGNISLLVQYGKKTTVHMLTNYGCFMPIYATTQFHSYKGQQVSIFTLSKQTPISVEGLKYPIQNRNLNYWWEGTLNESMSDKFTIISENAEVVVFQEYPLSTI